MTATDIGEGRPSDFADGYDVDRLAVIGGR